MTLMWSAESNQGDQWLYAAVELISDNDYSVVFEGSVGNGELSDMAIDDVTFTYGCSNPGIYSFWLLWIVFRLVH